jgi:hypothetical protein
MQWQFDHNFTKGRLQCGATEERATELRLLPFDERFSGSSDQKGRQAPSARPNAKSRSNLFP